MGFTDIKTDGLVARAPATWRPYLLLMRLDRPIGTWLLLLPGLWAIVMAGRLDMQAAWLCLLFAIGAVIMRGAGCVINDLWDRDLDRQVERTRLRPLASGAISRARAFVFLAVLLSAGLGILLQLGATAIWLGVASVAFIIAYPLMKRITWWPQAFLGLTFNFGALIGWAAVTGDVPLSAWLLYAAGIAWTIGYDTIYAHQDIEDDIKVGIRSTARLFGRSSRVCVLGFYGLFIILLAASLVTADEVVWVALAPAAHCLWQVVTWNPDSPSSSLRIFRSNRDCGLVLLALLMLTS